MQKFHWTHVISVGTTSVSSGFSDLMCSESVVFLRLLQSLCHELSSGANHSITTRRWLLQSPSLVGSQTWMSSTTNGRRLTFRGQSLYPIQWVEQQGWAHLRATPGLGYSGSSLPSWLGLSPVNLHYREDFSQSVHLG